MSEENIPMAEQIAENSGAEENKSYPMRVLLISNVGEMLTLLLPASMEGRYRFTDSSGVEPYPLFIIS